MTISVFLADDHSVVRDGLASLLALQPDLRVIGTAADGQDTVRQVEALKPDVVIMDIAMPRMNGIEAARAIRDRVPSARLLILSMHSSVEHIYHALEAGAHGYVLKDSAAQEIIEAVRAVRAGRRYLSPRVGELMVEVLARGRSESPLKSLSKRERQVLQLVAEGRSSAHIAATLHLSPKTVDTYRSRLMQKLNIGDVAGLVKFAIQHGLTSID